MRQESNKIPHGSTRLAQLGTALAAKYGLDLKARQAYVRIEVPGLLPLVIEKRGKYGVLVAILREIAGDVAFEPGILLSMNAPKKVGWVPFGVTLGDMAILSTAARALDIDAAEVECLSESGQRLLAGYADQLGLNIAALGYLERGVRTSPVELLTERSDPTTWEAVSPEKKFTCSWLKPVDSGVSAGRRTEVARLAGVPEFDVHPLGSSEIWKDLSGTVDKVVLEVITSGPAHFWRAGGRYFFDDPFFGDIADIADLRYKKTRGFYDSSRANK